MVGQLGAQALSVAGDYSQGQAGQQLENANARIEQTNATSDEIAAKANAAQLARNSARVTGQAKAAGGASGVQAGTGSPLSVMHDIASEGELSRRLTIWKGQMQAKGALGQAAIDTAQGEGLAQAGQIKAITSASTFLTQDAEQAAAMGG